MSAGDRTRTPRRAARRHAYMALALGLLAGEASARGPLVIDEVSVAAAAAAQAPGVRAARLDAAAAEAAAVFAERARLPDLTLSARYGRLSSLAARYRSVSLDPSGQTPPLVFPQLLDSFGVRASLFVNVTDPFLRLAAAAEAAGEIAAARRLEAEAAQAKIVFDARSAYLLLRRAHLGAAIAEDTLRTAEEQDRLERDRIEAGVSPATRGLGFAVLAHGARVRREGARADVAIAEAALRPFLRPEDSDLPLLLADAPTSGATDPPDVDRAPLVAEVDRAPLVAEVDRAPLVAEGEPASVRALGRLGEAARAKVREETWALLPRLSVVANADAGAPSPRVLGATTLRLVRTWDVGVQLDIPLTALFAQSANLDAARHAHGAALARLEEARRGLRAQREGALAARAGARARLDLAARTLAASRRLAEARRGELSAGIVIPLDVMNAESELLRARHEAADAALELRLAEARLDLLAGRTTPTAPVRGAP